MRVSITLLSHLMIAVSSPVSDFDSDQNDIEKYMQHYRKRDYGAAISALSAIPDHVGDVSSRARRHLLRGNALQLDSQHLAALEQYRLATVVAPQGQITSVGRVNRTEHHAPSIVSRGVWPHYQSLAGGRGNTLAL